MSKINFECKFCNSIIESKYDLEDSLDCNSINCDNCNVIIGFNDKSMEIEWIEFLNIGEFRIIDVCVDNLHLSANYKNTDSSNVILYPSKSSKYKDIITLNAPNIINTITPLNIRQFAQKVINCRVFL